MKLITALSLAFLTTLSYSCTQNAKKSNGDETRTKFLDPANMDTTVKPGDDFFLYANGAWIKKTEIPASETNWGSFNTLYNNNEKNLHQILEDLAPKNNPIGSIEQKVGDLYISGMDTVTIEKLGYEPLKPILSKIEALKDYKGLISLSADSFKVGQGFLLGFSIGPDDKISTKNAVGFGQSGLNLPNRDYYFKTDSASEHIRIEYLKYITKLFSLTGTPEPLATKEAESILKLESELAKSHSTPVELRDPVKNYNKYTVQDFQKLTPNLDWKDLLSRLNASTDTILVGQPKYYIALNDLLKSQPIEVWKNLLRFTAISRSAPALSKAFRDAQFKFYSGTLRGQKEQKERWKTVVASVDNGLGELLGQVYVAKYFTPEAKQRMLDLVNNLQSVYKSRIEKLDWMSPETKRRAIEKLEKITKKIGYPDKWKKYDDVSIGKGTYYDNLVSIAKHDYKVMVAKVGKPVDKAEWGMTPPTVNAYYNPSFNEIVFPAGILQFPFFDKNADDAINYGAIGLVIGHEMTHGFDDQGRQYDMDGNLKDWWVKQDEEKFKAKVKVMIDQYDKFTVLNGLHVNGSLTQGENLADIGGLAIAYQAFKNTEQGKGNTKIDGFSPDQRFFLSLAQVWQSKSRDEAVRMGINVDPHSPDKFRVNGPVSNMPEFYAAFGVKSGDKLYRPESDRVKVW